LAHFAALTWKVVFALVPPKDIWGGYAALFSCIAFIGIVTLIVGDCASVLGCTLGWPDSVTAITLVALGTSLPDTFASMTAAQTSDSADAAIGNVTGSNSVNIFLGLGLPWVLAAHYCKANDQQYVTPAGNLGFSVVIFLVVSITCFIVLIARRNFIGGELGGPPCSRYLSCFFMIFLWLIYLILSILRAGEIIKVDIGAPIEWSDFGLDPPAKF
jgi:solute carrier family 8 (sodium/calcium exchanger)